MRNNIYPQPRGLPIFLQRISGKYIILTNAGLYDSYDEISFRLIFLIYHI